MTSAKPQKILRVGLSSEIDEIDPREVQEYATVLVMRQVFEAPYVSRKAGAPMSPLLFAAPLMLSREGNRAVYRGRLRDDAKFSDGTPVTPADVVRCLSTVESITDIATVRSDRDDVVFEMPEPSSRLETVLGLRWCSIVREKDGALLGTGPYAVSDDPRDNSVRLVRNHHCPIPAPIDEILFKVYPPTSSGRSEALIQAVANGEVDFTPSLSREEVSELEGVRKLFRPGSCLSFLFLNTARPWLAEKNVRQAIRALLDHHALASTSYSNPAAFIARSPLPPSMSQHRQPVRQDLDLAKRLLAGAPPPPADPLRMLVVWAPRPYLPHPTQTANALRGQFEQMGINIEPFMVPSSGAYFDCVRRGDYDMVLGGWMADTPDPADFLEALFSSEMIPLTSRSAVFACNLGRWKDADMDAALARYRNNPGPDTLEVVLERARDEVPLIPLMYGPTAIVHSWRVRGFVPEDEAEPEFAVLDIEE